MSDILLTVGKIILFRHGTVLERLQTQHNTTSRTISPGGLREGAPVHRFTHHQPNSNFRVPNLFT
jgi:hypothetical protein